MVRVLVLAISGFFLAAGFPAPLTAQSDAEWAALEEQDIRLARLGQRLLQANAALCEETMPLTGLILHSADQYREGAAAPRFINGTVAVMALVPESPAAIAGIQQNDGLLSINGQRLDDLRAEGNGNLREAVFDVLSEQEPALPLELVIARDGDEFLAGLEPPAGCRALIEIRVGDGPRAQSDGIIVQIDYAFALELSDEELAAVLAHEIAHNILEHRRRKEEAGIRTGFLGELGRDRRANRAAEIEADRLSAHLLANAGFAPTIASSFFREGPGRNFGGILGSRIYPSPSARADIIDEEISQFLPADGSFSAAAHLVELRDQSFADD